MIESNLIDKVCNQHEMKIVSFCQNKSCNQQRLVCHGCLDDKLHCQHLEKIVNYQNLEHIVKSTSSQCMELLLKLTDLMDAIINIFQKIKLGIDGKYHMTIERINKINNEQLDQYISNMCLFSENEQYLLQQILNGCNSFQKDLENCLAQLQLDQLIYNQINDLDKEKSENLYKQGYVLYSEKNDYEGAIKLFDQALAYNPQHFNALWCKGASLRMLGKLEEQVESYNKALMIEPQHVLSLFGKGDALRLMGQFKEAIEWYEKALKIDSKHVLSLFGKGDALKMMGFYELSMDWYQKALDIDQKHVLSLFGMGDALRLMRLYKESIEWYQKALHLDPKHVLSLYGKGDALRILQQYPVALEYLDKALLINPHHHLSLGSKGACLISMQRYQEALVFLNKAIQIDPHNKFTQKQLTICQERLQK